VFYPGALPVRALVAERHEEPHQLERLPGYETAEAALAARATYLGSNPWLDRFPAALRNVVPTHGADGHAWALVDREERALSLTDRRDWLPLVALSGGHPVDVFGELEGAQLRPLAAVADGRMVSLA
jgi:hypothetical protein